MKAILRSRLRAFFSEIANPAHHASAAVFAIPEKMRRATFVLNAEQGGTMKFDRTVCIFQRRFALTLTAILALTALSTGFASTPLPAGLRLLAEYAMPGIEPEISGIQPNPTDNKLYFLLANKKPVYSSQQKPTLPEKWRGKLLSVETSTGAVVRAFDLVDGQYGGLAYGEGHLFVASLNPPEILKVNPETGQIVSRAAVSGPIGGLEYDRDRKALIAQMFTGTPRLEVIDPNSGATIESLWSDETAMDLKKVSGLWLCTWVSGFDDKAFGELRLINQTTGRVQGRMRLPEVLTSMGRLDKKVAGHDGFISMATLSQSNGTVALREYAFDADTAAWVR
jgi:hypothetical protein